MLSRSLLSLAVLAAAAFAQTSTIEQTGSISGVVRDAATGKPIPEAFISDQRAFVKTDSEGRYTLKGLAAGRHELRVMPPAQASRALTLSAGQELTGVDFRLSLGGQISGRILDKNKEPVLDATVFLVAREYSLGALRYIFVGSAKTNDQGAYTLKNVKPGRAFLVWLRPPRGKLPAISDAPADPKLRRTVPAPTFYPNSPVLEGAQPITLRSGENREAIDIVQLRSQSFCIDGVFQTGANAPVEFSIAERQPGNASIATRGMSVPSPSGVTGPDGKVRICDLAPGEYRITGKVARSGADVPLFGSTLVAIGDRDLHDLRFPARPAIPVSGDIVFDGAPPEKADASKINIQLMPITEIPAFSELERLSVASQLPGQFAYPYLALDDYTMWVSGIGSAQHIKDITYGGRSALYEPLRVGSAMSGSGIRIVVARDGGTISAQVSDKDGKPVADARVAVLPASAPTEAALADMMVTGQTDQNGAWSGRRMAPGKYYVVATEAELDKSPECIAALWRVRTRAQEVELAPNGASQVKLVPIDIR